MQHLYPETYASLRRSSSYEFEIEEYVPPRISIDGPLGEFRPSPLASTFGNQQMQHGKLSPVVGLPPANEPLTGSTQVDHSRDMSDTARAKQSANPPYFASVATSRDTTSPHTVIICCFLPVCWRYRGTIHVTGSF